MWIDRILKAMVYIGMAALLVTFVLVLFGDLE